MKYMVFHKHPNYPNDLPSIVGFTNSLDNFVKNNTGYTYKKENLRLFELREDVFAGVDIRQQSNMADYARMCFKPTEDIDPTDILEVGMTDSDTGIM